MIGTAFIGADSPLGKLAANKLNFDCLITAEKLQQISGQSFNHLVCLCPTLWKSPAESRKNVFGTQHYIAKLMAALNDVKVDRLTYISNCELLEQEGNENTPQLASSEDELTQSLIELRNFMNLRFGRILHIQIPSFIGLGAGYSVLDEFREADIEASAPHLALLEHQQFYPIQRLLPDINKAWSLGLFSVIFATPPITNMEIAECLFPDVVKLLPVAKTTDKLGSLRSSIHSIHWNDPVDGYIMTKEEVMTFLEMDSFLTH